MVVPADRSGIDWAVVSDRATLELCECSTCGHAVVAISDGNCAGSPDLDTCWAVARELVSERRTLPVDKPSYRSLGIMRCMLRLDRLSVEHMKPSVMV